MGRATTQVKIIEAKTEELQALIPEMKAALARCDRALYKRNAEMRHLLECVDRVEALSAKGEPVQKAVAEFELSGALLKKLNVDLETCRVALKLVTNKYKPTADVDPKEINDLIADKAKKAAGKPSTGLQALQKSWIDYLKLLNAVKGTFKDAREGALNVLELTLPDVSDEVAASVRKVPEQYKNC